MNPLTKNKSGFAVLDQRPSRKVFALEDILAVTTGLSLSAAGAGAVDGVVGFITETEPCSENTAEYISAARTCLAEQLPFLQQLDLRALAAQVRTSPAQMDLHVKIWVEKQSHLYGAAHQLFSAPRWQRIKNSHKL